MSLAVTHLVGFGAKRAEISGSCGCTPAYVTGDRTSSITVTSSFTPSGGSVGNWVNGSTSGFNTSSSWYYTGSFAGENITFDFGSGASIKITEAQFYWQSSGGGFEAKWQGSNDGVSYADIGSGNFTAGASVYTETTLSANANGYRYYRMLGISGDFGAGLWLYEAEFKQCTC